MGNGWSLVVPKLHFSRRRTFSRFNSSREMLITLQFSQFPKKLLFPVDYFGSSYLTNPPSAGTAADTFNTFITKLEGFLNTTRTEMSLAAIWNTTKPAAVSAPSLQTLLSTTYADLITLDQIDLVADPFIADFGAANGGRMPFIDPIPLARWSYGRALPAGRKEDALANKTIFMDWFSSSVVPPDATSCSDSIFLYPQSSGGTNYRNRYIRFVVFRALYSQTHLLMVIYQCLFCAVRLFIRTHLRACRSTRHGCAK